MRNLKVVIPHLGIKDEKTALSVECSETAAIAKGNNIAPKRVAFFGHFDTTNFGNESTLQSILYHLRCFQPRSKITCICDGPETVAAAYGIKAVPLSYIKSRSPTRSILTKAVLGLPSEFYGLLKGFITLSRMHMLIVPGTGLLTDAYGLRGWGPYNSFKWSVLAKICGCKLLYVSVGAGPVYTFLGRFLVRSALTLADFRSYRDNSTKQCLNSIGLRADNDPVYPDLVFSFPESMLPQQSAEKNERYVVGLGLMIYAEKYSVSDPDIEIQRTYMNILTTFAHWLVAHEHDVRLLIGDLADMGTKEEFKELLRGVLEERDCKHIIDEPIQSVESLLAQIAMSEIVVATRFHNVLLALLCNKPVIAISFHHKCDSLMAAMGLSEYCLNINSLRANVLIEKFCELKSNTDSLKLLIKGKVDQFRQELDKQYNTIFQ